jgi:hypothetical protein
MAPDAIGAATRTAAVEYAADPDGWADRRRAETRAEQGLPPVVTDPVAITQITASVGPWLDQQAERQDHGKRGAA